MYKYESLQLYKEEKAYGVDSQQKGLIQFVETL